MSAICLHSPSPDLFSTLYTPKIQQETSTCMDSNCYRTWRFPFWFTANYSPFVDHLFPLFICGFFWFFLFSSTIFFQGQMACSVIWMESNLLRCRKAFILFSIFLSVVQCRPALCLPLLKLFPVSFSLSHLTVSEMSFFFSISPWSRSLF